MQHFNCCIVRNGKLRLKLSFLIIMQQKKTTNWIFNRTGIVKRKHIFEAETPAHHAICPSLRYFKPMEVHRFF